jgi:hypothetical protein
MERIQGMKKLLGVVFALFLFCMPLGIEANDVLSYEYIGQLIKIEDAVAYYSLDEDEYVTEAPIDCGKYIAIYSDGTYLDYEIVPKKVQVKVTYNKKGDLEESKYLCLYDGDYSFKLRVLNNGDFESIDDYNGNVEFEFEPKNASDDTIEKKRITHPDVEYVYSESGIQIYCDLDQVKPIVLKNVGEYMVSFDVDSRYYESIPFKVTILPKTVQLHLPKYSKYVNEKNPVFENEDYVLSREPGEDVGDYKLSVKSKSKNYRYEIVENAVFSILDRNTENVRMDTSKGSGASDETKAKEKAEVNQSESKVKMGVSDFTLMYVGLLILSMVGFFQIKRMK